MPGWTSNEYPAFANTRSLVESLNLLLLSIQNSINMNLSYRSTGQIAIASGLIGIFAFGFLLAAVTTRTTMAVSSSIYFMFRAHDVFFIIQMILLIPVAFGLYNITNQQSVGIGRTTLILGVVALSITIIILLLVFPKVLPDDYYPVPVGIFGIWLITVCWNMRKILKPALRWFGIIVGFGLTLFGIYPIGYFFLVDPRIFHIPPVDPASLPDPSLSVANTILHLMILVGSFIGVLPLPFWTILIGRRFLQERTNKHII